MAKLKVFENKAFEAASVIPEFNLIPQVNSFNSIFDTKPLDGNEKAELEKLLHDGILSKEIALEQITQDLSHLEKITSEIKAIRKQGAILIGERVHKAREILKPYKDGTFTRWLESTFGTRKSGYNVLSYYELYMALPHETLREIFKKLQHRTAYILASRAGDLEIKAEIIQNHHDRPHRELLSIIQERLPLPTKDKRKKKFFPKKLVSAAKKIVDKLSDQKEDLSAKDKSAIIELRDSLNLLIA